MGLRFVVEVLRLAILHIGMSVRWRIISKLAAIDAGFLASDSWHLPLLSFFPGLVVAWKMAGWFFSVTTARTGIGEPRRA